MSSNISSRWTRDNTGIEYNGNTRFYLTTYDLYKFSSEDWVKTFKRMKMTDTDISSFIKIYGIKDGR